jgi:hypothetical protein
LCARFARGSEIEHLEAWFKRLRLTQKAVSRDCKLKFAGECLERFLFELMRTKGVAELL